MKPGPDKQFIPAEALNAAIRVFWARGYEAASLSELTAEMGIGKKSLYDTFGNKRELFLKALEAYSHANIAELRAHLLNDGSPFENLKQMMQGWVERHSKPCSKGCMLGNNMADFDTDDVEVAQALHRKIDGVERVFLETLEKAIQAGEISANINALNTARTLVCLSQGSALVGRVSEDSDRIQGAVNTILDYLNQT